jgi:simple sugar transport system permease protein
MEAVGVGEVREPWYRAMLVPFLAVLTALTVGAVIIVFSNGEALTAWSTFFADPLGALRASGTAVADAYGALFAGALGSPRQIAEAIGSGSFSEVQRSLIPLSETIVTATPLILAGLSVALGFRAGLFNIGAEGQITAGGMLGAMAGFSLGGLPGPLHLALMVLAGFVGGAVWGAIPGILKARTGAHEVITTIMLNFVAFRLADYALSTRFFLPPNSNAPIAKPVVVAYPHLLGSALRVHVGIFVALALAVGVAWLLNRTTVGFEFRAVGSNPDAARTAGMSPGRTYVMVMALAGGLAGLAGANQLASATPSLASGFSSGFGFDAIALALLGRARPAGVVAAAFLFAVLRVGGRQMQVVTQTPPDIVTVIEALVLLFVAAPALVRAIFRVRARRVAGAEVFTKGWSG